MQMNRMLEYITEQMWIKMSCVHASNHHAKDAECKADAVHISDLRESRLIISGEGREGGWDKEENPIDLDLLIFTDF